MLTVLPINVEITYPQPQTTSDSHSRWLQRVLPFPLSLLSPLVTSTTPSSLLQSWPRNEHDQHAHEARTLVASWNWCNFVKNLSFNITQYSNILHPYLNILCIPPCRKQCKLCPVPQEKRRSSPSREERVWCDSPQPTTPRDRGRSPGYPRGRSWRPLRGWRRDPPWISSSRTSPTKQVREYGNPPKIKWVWV